MPPGGRRAMDHRLQQFLPFGWIVDLGECDVLKGRGWDGARGRLHRADRSQLVLRQNGYRKTDCFVMDVALHSECSLPSFIIRFLTRTPEGRRKDPFFNTIKYILVFKRGDERTLAQPSPFSIQRDTVRFEGLPVSR
jgi:hypothetical protein